MHICSVNLQLANVSAVRIARGSKLLHVLHGYASSVFIWWYPAHTENKQVYESMSSFINCKEIIGEDYQDVYTLQALMTTDADADADYEQAHAHHHERALDVTLPTSPHWTNDNPATTTTTQKDLQHNSSTSHPIVYPPSTKVPTKTHPVSDRSQHS